MFQPNPVKLPNWWVPKLHEGLAPPSANEAEIREWCQDNCQDRYYMYPEWSKKKGAQFEDDDDARSFICWSRLRWE